MNREDLLERAVRQNNLNEAREQLENGADPNFLYQSNAFFLPLINLAISKNYVDIAKLLVTHGSTVNSNLINEILSSENIPSSVDLLAHIIEIRKDNEILQMIFAELFNVDFERPTAVDFLRLLVDHGFDIDDYIVSKFIWTIGETPLHFSIENQRRDIVSCNL